ncbi:MAG TPA: hypothetical protein VGX23_11705 [Actinocrinis sp.]|nr:hypothetical protein [Actinocrinis sp.]
MFGLFSQHRITLCNHSGHCRHRPATQATITLTSPAFADEGEIPAAYTCDAAGSAVSPPLAWTGVPQGTGWLALYVYDDTGSVLHWIVVNIEPAVTGVAAGGLGGGTEVANYLPMCPGTGNSDQYEFYVYAEPASYHLAKIGPSYAVDPDALASHALGVGTLYGNYRQ